MTEKRQAAAGLDFHLLLLLLLLLFHSSALAQKLETEPVGTRTALGAIGQTFSNAIRFVRSGQAEFAVELFRTAFEADNSFLLAKAWEMRAYQMLSLEEHAALVRRQLLDQPRGPEFLRRFENRDRLVLEIEELSPEDLQTQAAPAVDPKKFNPWATYTPEHFALALRHFSENPSDRQRLMLLYQAYHARQWEHRIVLMQRLLSLVRPDEPDAANWMSTALWRIREERYRRGAGYAYPPNPVKADFQRLLREHPNSFSAYCLQYSLGLEAASQGQHHEAADLFLEAAQRLAAEADMEVPYVMLANAYFFAARENYLIGRTKLARDLVGKLLEFEALARRSHSAKNASGGDRKVHTIGAIGIDFRFKPELAQGFEWVLHSFTFGLDRQGRIYQYERDQFWDSIVPDIQRLQNALGIRPSDDSGMSLELLSFHIKESPENADARSLRYRFVIGLLARLQEGEKISSLLLYEGKENLRWLFENSQNQAEKTRVVKMSREAILKFEQMNPDRQPDPTVMAEFALAVQDWHGVLQIFDRYLQNPEWRIVCGNLWIKGLALRKLYGPRAEADLYQQRLSILKHAPGSHDPCYAEVILRAGAAFRRAGDLSAAAAAYEQALAVLSSFEPNQETASVLLQWADTEALRGNFPKALRHFSQLLDWAEGSNWGLYEPAEDWGGGYIHDNIYRLAARRLTELSKGSR